jgi:leucyl aminopeptidase
MPLALQLSAAAATTITADVLALCVTQSGLEKQRTLTAVDTALGGALMAQAKRAEFEGKPDQLLEIPTLGMLPAGRVLLVGVGPARRRDDSSVRVFAACAARAASGSSSKSLALALPERVAGAGPLRAVAEGVVLGAYRFTKYFTGERAPKTELREVTIVKTDGRVSAAEKAAVVTGAGVGRAVCIARDAVNEPPNVIYPETLARLAQDVARRGRLRITVLDKQGIARAGMKLHFAVGQGSAHEPRFIHITYAPRNARRKLAFVGKGLTFDSGGLCIKPAPGMGEMKSDMGGAAAVIALMAAVAQLRPPVEVHGIVAAAENMPDGSAYRPGDIFGSLDGKTVEIINTDAEGRLVLADALAYARKLEPNVIIDAATLTGACVVALGKSCSAYYTAEAGLAREMELAARESGEAFWRMPLLDDLKEQLKSDCADLKHTGDRWGGSITAALFLREFVGEVPWIHCDIAGPALADRARGIHPKGGTGHPVLTFLRFVENS